MHLACSVASRCAAPSRSVSARLCAAALCCSRPSSRQSAAATPSRRCERVDFDVPGKGATPFKHVTQRALDNILTVTGALGFLDANGLVSQEVEDLPEGGTVKLVLPEDPPLTTQVSNLQQVDANITRGKEQQLSACLQNLASLENPGCAITVLPTTPFKTAKGQDYVQLDAPVVAGHTLYLGKHKRVLGEDGVDALALTVNKIRRTLRGNLSPDLLMALQGVTHVKLFLSGEAVQQGLAVQELVDLAAVEGMGVVLPSGQGLEVVGATPAEAL